MERFIKPRFDGEAKIFRPEAKNDRPLDASFFQKLKKRGLFVGPDRPENAIAVEFDLHGEQNFFQKIEPCGHFGFLQKADKNEPEVLASAAVQKIFFGWAKKFGLGEKMSGFGHSFFGKLKSKIDRCLQNIVFPNSQNAAWILIKKKRKRCVSK